VNNAGVPRRLHASRLTFDDVEQTMRVNYLGPMALTFALLPSMIEAGRGEIVTVGSAAGRLVAPREAAYAGSKAALAAVSECLAADLAGTGVRVHLVTPGVIDTPLWDDPDQERTPVAGEPIAASKVVDAILALIGGRGFERYVPRSLRAAAIMKPILGRGFIRSAARFDRRRVPEAYG
jgi:short-subunit dehydrogenase